MYTCEKLTKRNFKYFIPLNENRSFFNALNLDFIESYDKAGFAEQVFLRKQVRLLKFNNDYIGFMWVKKQKRKQYTIQSFYISDSDLYVDACNFLLSELKCCGILEYYCEKNDFNFPILSTLGFIMGEGTFELKKIIESQQAIDDIPQITYESFLRGIHEEIRCDLQNEIFRNNNREPLDIEDIYYDVTQQYFWDKGSVFIKFENKYIGYGQIILDGKMPTIVNFGIISEFRTRGYGKLLLNYLLNLLNKYDYKEVKLKVNSENILAYQLYLKLGFHKEKEYYCWTKIL